MTKLKRLSHIFGTSRASDPWIYLLVVFDGVGDNTLNITITSICVVIGLK